MLDPRGYLLRAAVGFALVPTEPELRLPHRWPDSWRGCRRRRYENEPARVLATPEQYRRRTWHVTFSRESMISAHGFGAGDTPWRAVQRAAWAALREAA